MTFGENRREKKPRSLMARGLDALARREYSRDELYRKLTHSLSEDETSDDVANVIADLEKKGYLSNERYAAGRVRTRAMRYGNRRLAAELRQQGVETEAIAEALADAESEIDRARAVWNRKFGEAPLDYHEKCKQVRFLAARGFSFDIINRVLAEAGDRTENIEEC